MDILNDSFQWVVEPNDGSSFPEAVVYFEFGNEERIVADLTTPLYDWCLEHV